MIDEAQIQYLERLARIRLSPEQRSEFQAEIGRILTYMERLAAIDESQPGAAGGPAAAGAACDSSGTGAADAAFGSGDCRPDELRPTLAREALLASSPQATDEYMTVPRAVQ